MAYLILTDWNYESVFPATFDPEGGENAVILQPGGTWSGPSLALDDGPCLYRRARCHVRWEQTPCELAVELHPGMDPEAGTWDDADPDDQQLWNTYFAALCEDKIGGAPVPTNNTAETLAAYISGGWRPLLQLNAQVNEGDQFFLNISYDGVGYAFISPDGRSGEFPWSR